MAHCKLATFLLLTSILAWQEAVQASDCTFTIPSTTDPSSCVLYYLTEVAGQGPFKLSADIASSYDLMFTLCGNVSSPSLPKQCSSTSASAAVAYNNNSCYSLGNSRNESTYVASLYLAS